MRRSFISLNNITMKRICHIQQRTFFVMIFAFMLSIFLSSKVIAANVPSHLVSATEDCNLKIILFGTDSPKDDNVNTNGGLLSGTIISSELIGQEIELTSKNNELIFSNFLDKTTYFLAGGSTSFKILVTSNKTRFYISPANLSYNYDSNGDYKTELIIVNKNYHKQVIITSKLLLYRGVGFMDDIQNANAKQGIVIPNGWGKVDCFVNPYMHSGPPSNNHSVFTSWSTKYIVAAYFALGMGGAPNMPDAYILQQKIDHKFTFGPRVGAANNIWEHEVLLIGSQRVTGTEAVKFANFGDIGSVGMAMLKYNIDTSLTKNTLDNIKYGDEWQAMPTAIPCFIIGYKGNKYPNDLSNLAKATAMLSQNDLEVYILNTLNSQQSSLPVLNNQGENKWSTDPNGVLCLGLNRKILPTEQLLIKNILTNELGYSKKMRYIKNVSGVENSNNQNDYPIIIINGPVGMDSPIYGNRQEEKPLSEENRSKKNIVYPNPATNTLNIEGLKETTLVDIYTLLGVKIFSRETSHSIGIKNIEPGMYLIKIHDDIKPSTQLIRIEL